MGGYRRSLRALGERGHGEGIVIVVLRETLAVLFIVGVVIGVFWAIVHLTGECLAYWREYREEES